MLSDFRALKIKKLFAFWDADNNGYLEKKDYALVGEKLSVERNWPKGSPEYDYLMGKLMEDWAEAEKFADTNRDQKISIDEWLVFCEAFTQDAEMYKITVTNVASAIFDAVDIDINGILEEHEWQLLFRIYGKINEEATWAFNFMTDEGKTTINKENLLKLLDCFFYSEDEDNAGNFMFGPLS